MNPSEGTVGETVFTLRCKEWVADNTDDLPLTYSFYARPPGAVADAPPLALSQRKPAVSLQTTLPNAGGHQALRPRESGGRRDDHVHDRGQPPMGANVSDSAVAAALADGIAGEGGALGAALALGDTIGAAAHVSSVVELMEAVNETAAASRLGGTLVGALSTTLSGGAPTDEAIETQSGLVARVTSGGALAGGAKEQAAVLVGAIADQMSGAAADDGTAPAALLDSLDQLLKSGEGEEDLDGGDGLEAGSGDPDDDATAAAAPTRAGPSCGGGRQRRRAASALLRSAPGETREMVADGLHRRRPRRAQAAQPTRRRAPRRLPLVRRSQSVLEAAVADEGIKVSVPAEAFGWRSPKPRTNAKVVRDGAALRAEGHCGGCSFCGGAAAAGDDADVVLVQYRSNPYTHALLPGAPPSPPRSSARSSSASARVSSTSSSADGER